MNNLVLVVDDDKKIANLIDFRLKRQGYSAQTAFSGQSALEDIKKFLPLLVMLDIRLPDMNGIDVLKEIKKNYPNTHVIMISAHADVKAAVECMQAGAYDFIEKPLAFPEMDAKVKRVFEQYRLEEEVSMLKRELGEKYQYKSLVGKSPEMKKIFDAIGLAAKSGVNVMIEGESGTGKEMVARAIHFSGPQKEGPFVAVNCGAIPENLLESELFGHERGAFTGAASRRIGKFEQAQGGTLFFDEMADLPGPLQVKLLRALQEREIERVGGSGPIPINVRFIIATNKDLRKMVQQEKFREDLYFRINVFPIRIPPLRARREDIPELLKYFIQKTGKDPARIGPDALKILMAYRWPGNIRELENFVERLMLVKRDHEDITADDIAPLLDHPFVEMAPGAPAETEWGTAGTLTGLEKDKIMGSTEKMLLEKALHQAGGNISKACKLINISRDTFYRKMKKYALLSSSSVTVPPAP